MCKGLRYQKVSCHLRSVTSNEMEHKLYKNCRQHLKAFCFVFGIFLIDPKVSSRIFEVFLFFFFSFCLSFFLSLFHFVFVFLSSGFPYRQTTVTQSKWHFFSRKNFFFQKKFNNLLRYLLEMKKVVREFFKQWIRNTVLEVKN